MNKQKNIEIIPARGRSKRIPGKDIKDFLGKPIIAYSIEAAIDSNLFDELMVSTADDEILNILKKTVSPFRPLADLAKEKVGFKGELFFNADKPDGTMRKLTDVTKLHDLGWKHVSEIEEGI